MTLKEATQLALSAAVAGDLDALAKGLAARAEAITAGDVPTPEIIAMGQKILELLRALIRSGVLEFARLGQIQAGFAGSLSMPPHIDYFA